MVYLEKGVSTLVLDFSVTEVKVLVGVSVFVGGVGEYPFHWGHLKFTRRHNTKSVHKKRNWSQRNALSKNTQR